VSDRRRDTTFLLRPHGGIPHSLNGYSDVGTAPLTAASQVLLGTESQRPLVYENWQEEVWEFYASLGEFNYGVEWFAEALSRVRLSAAKVTPGGDEPELLDSGPAAEIVSQLCGGTDGQAQLLRSLGVQISVPGDCFFVGRQVTASDVESGALLDAEPDEYGRIWTVQPSNTLRHSRRTVRNVLGRQARGWDLQVDDARWVTLPAESLVCRIWDRNEHFPWRANSPARAALPIMREIDMYNRYIIATLVSRVALNGMLLIPDEVILPVNPDYENSGDPFVAELIDLMRSAIKNPGSPASAAPLPLRIPAEMIDKFKHFTFATPLDQKMFEYRGQAIRRLATTLNLPAEIVTGMGDVNHWSSWQLTEDAIKIHISPKVEIITRALTIGYLHPVLQALGEKTRESDGSRIIMWYDTSELTQRPDRSAAAIQLRQMLVITDAATRRETGFDDADAPTDDELEKMVLMQLAVNPQTAAPALKELTGLELEMASQQPVPVTGESTDTGGPVGDGSDDDDDQSSDEPVTGPPSTRDQPPPSPDEGVTAAGQRDTIVRQSHSSRRRASLLVGERHRG
jgi:hypothetical protein